VEQIVDLSRLGEFETCKALLNLVNMGVLRPVAPSRRGPKVGLSGDVRDLAQRLEQGAARVLATVAIAAALAGLAWYVNQRGLAWEDPHRGRTFRDNGAQRFLARYSIARISGALEVYHLERGEYPPDLGSLVEAGLVSTRDLSYPWSQGYYYRRKPDGSFALFSPVE
jgi:hypothetical protein